MWIWLCVWGMGYGGCSYGAWGYGVWIWGVYGEWGYGGGSYGSGVMVVSFGWVVGNVVVCV